MQNCLRTISILCLIAAAPATGLAQRGPNTADPEAPLALTTSDEALVKLHADAARDVRLSSFQAAELVKQAAANPKKIALKHVGQAYVAAVAAQRAGERLSACGEVAGEDLLQRADALQRKIYETAVGVRPHFAEKLAAGLNVLRKASDDRRKVLTQVEKLLDQGKLLPAAERAYAANDFLQAMGVWYNPPEREGPLGDFANAARHVTSQLIEADKARLSGELSAALTSNKPDYPAFLQHLKTAATQLGASGQASFSLTASGDRGETPAMLDGPAVLEKVTSQLGHLQQQALAYEAQSWVRAAMTAQPAASSVRKDHDAFIDGLPAQLSALIAADASRASAAEVRTLYPRYVQAAADFALHTSDPAAAAASLSGALDQLAGREEAFSQEVEAYRAATHDLLRWRRRAGDSAARRWRTECPPVGNLAISPELSSPAPLVMAAAGQSLVGQQHSFAQLIGTSASGKATSAYRNLVRARAALDHDRALAALQTDLLVELGPLSLEAAICLGRVARGDLLEVGGEVTGVELEPLAPLCVHPTDDDVAVCAVGPLTALGDAKAAPQRQVRLRIDVAPKWILLEHAFFVVE